MKTTGGVILLNFALIAMLLLATMPAAADSDVTSFEGYGYGCYYVRVPKTWTSADGVLHARNAKGFNIYVSEDPPMMWTSTSHAAYDLAMTTLSGRSWGTEVHKTDAGLWHGMFKGDWTAGVYTAHEVAHGSQGLAGQVLYMDLEQLFYIPEPDPCPEPGAGGAYRITGTMVNPKGD